MDFTKRALILAVYLVFGCFLSYAQDIKQPKTLSEKAVAPLELEQQNVQIGKAGTVVLITETDNGKIGNGSGFFVQRNLIVTNIHVVAGIHGKSFRCRAKSIDLSTQYTINGVVASDPEHDLVILKVEGESDSILEIGDSDAVELGEKIVAIGTHEDVSGEIVKGTINRITTDFFHVKAVLPPGYSGGPVLNDVGKVIGICVEGGETKSLGYVIPSNYLKALLKNIRTQEKPLAKWREEPMIRAYALVRQGNERMALGDAKDAIEVYDAAIRLKPDFAAAYARRAEAKYNLGGYKGMVKDYDAAIHFSEKDTNFAAHVYSSRASTKLDIGDNKGAIEDADAAIQINPELADAYAIRGDAKLNLRNHNGAIKDYDTAIYLKPNYTEAYHKRGNAKIEIGRISEAKIDFRTALKFAKPEGTQSLKDEIEKALRLLE